MNIECTGWAALLRVLAKIAEMLKPMELNGVWTVPATAFVVAAQRH